MGEGAREEEPRGVRGGAPRVWEAGRGLEGDPRRCWRAAGLFPTSREASVHQDRRVGVAFPLGTDASRVWEADAGEGCRFLRLWSRAHSGQSFCE